MIDAVRGTAPGGLLRPGAVMAQGRRGAKGRARRMEEMLETFANGTDNRQAGAHTANIKEKSLMETADHLLDIAEAAQVLNTSKDWLYRNWKKFPFVVQLSPRQLRFSSKGIVRYVEEKQHGRLGIQAG